MSSHTRARLAGLIGAALVVLSVAGLLTGGFILGQRLAQRSVAIGETGASVAPSEPATSPAAPAPTASGPSVRLIGAGDIADCGSNHDEQTAAIVAGLPGIVFTAGDNAYPTGSAADLRKCYGPSWGQFKDRTHPTIGNHDIRSDDGAPYFDYFGAAAGTPLDGWYSYEAGTWHVVVLNSNCLEGVDCGEGSRQLSWLRADLAAHPTACTLAIWHHPRFSSGAHGSEPAVDPFWSVLYDAGADVIVNGHDHDYERFAPQTPDGQLDPQRGIREFVVGTGGAERRMFRAPPVANSEVRDARSNGVIVLDLDPGGYRWQFLSTASRAFGDAGSGTCH